MHSILKVHKIRAGCSTMGNTQIMSQTLCFCEFHLQLLFQ
uniref:Uncharacterized protein n=1 Tax=Anguilla anguilla TaxID=7936 RepID=A0A0E9Q8B5_ANGAN